MITDQTTPVRSEWLGFVLILLVFFIHGGAPPPHVNETHYLTKAKHYWEPAWCEGDFFLESADAHLVFYWSIGWLAKFYSLPTVAWIGRIAAWVALAWTWQRLCRCITRQPLAPVLGAALLVWLTSEYNFAGEWVVGGVEGKCFAYACVFAGLTNVITGRWHSAWPWFGLGGAFHVLAAGWAALAAGFVWLGEPRSGRPSLASMAPTLGLALVLALPGIVPALLLTRGMPPEVASEANVTYVFERLPHHLALWSQPAEVIERKLRRFTLPLLAFVILWWLARNARPTDGELETPLNRLCRFAAWSLLFSLAGMTWEFVCANNQAMAAAVLKYYWFRLADIAVPTAAAVLVCYWVERLWRESSKFAPAALALALLCGTWHLADVTAARWSNPTPPADNSLAAPAAWREACEWVRDNTPSGSLCLVPRSSQTLSWYGSRKSLVTWKDVPQDAAGILMWRDRYQDVFLHVDEFGELVPYASLADQGDDRIRTLAAKYHVDYVITDEYPPLHFPVVYANPWYKVYAVSPTAETSLESSP